MVFRALRNYVVFFWIKHRNVQNNWGNFTKVAFYARVFAVKGEGHGPSSPMVNTPPVHTRILLFERYARTPMYSILAYALLKSMTCTGNMTM